MAEIFKSYRQESRKDWGITQEEGHAPDINRIHLGALLRIADAAEKMAQNHAILIDERDRYKRLYDEKVRYAKMLYRSNVSLRGAITRLKKALAAKNNP